MARSDPWDEFALAEPEAAPSPLPQARDQWQPEAAPQQPVQDEWAEFGPALDQIVNEAVSGEDFDRSTVPVLNEGVGLPKISDQVETRETEWAKRYADQLGAMIANGAPDDQVRAFIRDTGGNLTGLDQVLAWRRTPEFQKWRAYNPGAGYPVGRTEEVPLTGFRQGWADWADSPVGAFAGGAAKSRTFQFLDEAVGALGGDRQDFQLKQELLSGAYPISDVAGQIAGGIGLPSGVASSARNAAMQSLRTTRGLDQAARIAAARQAAAQAIVKRSAAEGAGFGALQGAGAGDTLAERAAGAGAGAALGAGTGAGLGAIGNRIAGRRGMETGEEIAGNGAEQAVDYAAGQLGSPSPQQIAAAAQRQQVNILPADVGGPVTRRATSVMQQTMAGGQPLIRGAERTVETARAARDRIAEGFAEALDPEAAGQAVIRGAKEARNTTRDEARSFYGPAEARSKGFQITPTKALDALDRNIEELAETPGGEAGLSTLRQIRNDLASGKTTVRGVRAMRTTLRDRFAETGLRGSDIERRVNQVVDAAAEDTVDSLGSAGMGDVAAQFARGDALWRQRADLIDNTFEPIIGTRANPKSGEAVVKSILSDMQGNQARAIKLLRSLPEAEQNTLRASVISGLGRPSNGAPDDFSLPYFLSQWNKLGDRAKAAYFGPEGRAALNDLETIARARRDSSGYLNRSNTGGIIANGATLGTGLAGYPALLGTIVAQYAGGAVLSSNRLAQMLARPRFARWVARSARTKDPETYVNRLSAIARAEPAIANDVLGLQEQLRSAFGNSVSPARLAAEQSVNEPTRVQEQQQSQE